ncbi:hypothetical protein [Microvirga pudoricolor]|uniref:hypothetical protein n=1 Tax=Microvirga pudoricolor TaxID=2778729 RepID=UPI00194F509D|nr:hypothetical protein [Microvirga pudoricolor]MBM6596496.1 hypothetical protein [Microvirga pudoricolor]
MHINDVVAGLLHADLEAAPLLRQEFVIRLAMWLRFSGQPVAYDVACMAGCLSYLSVKRRDANLSELPSGEAALLQRVIKIGCLTDALHGILPTSDYPEFELFAEYGDDYHEYPYIADAIKFLLWYAPRSNDKRQQASLQKAYFFLMKEGFSHWAHFSRRYFIKQWTLHRSASSLLYVMYHHMERDLLLDPRDVDFSTRVDTLAEDISTIHDLFAQAKWVGEQLSRRLHPKAQKNIRLPVFPDSLISKEIPTVRLGDYVYDAFEDYSSDVDSIED